MKKKIIIGVVAFFILFVVVDYLGLFGVLHVDGGVSVPFKFRIIDSKESPVKKVSISVFIGSLRLGSRFEYEEETSVLCGETAIMTGWTKTKLFKKPLFKNRRINKQEIKFIFQHPEFVEQEKTFLIKDLKEGTHTIILQPKEQKYE